MMPLKHHPTWNYYKTLYPSKFARVDNVLKAEIAVITVVLVVHATDRFEGQLPLNGGIE